MNGLKCWNSNRGKGKLCCSPSSFIKRSKWASNIFIFHLVRFRGIDCTSTDHCQRYSPDSKQIFPTAWLQSQIIRKYFARRNISWPWNANCLLYFNFDDDEKKRSTRMKWNCTFLLFVSVMFKVRVSYSPQRINALKKCCTSFI